MSASEFTECYLNKTLEKLTYENKNLVLLGDFNIDLINFNNNTESSDFLETITSNSLMPLILQPTRITSHSKTLIDNIFTNITEKSVKLGNITCSISDHLAQFAILQVQTPNQTHNETELKRDFTKFNKNDFTLDFLQVDMEAHLKIRNNNADYSMTQLLNITEAILDKRAPYKKITKHKKILK